MNIIGRINEIDKLDAAMRSGMPEFIAVYGRRRVGKTFLVREYFNYRFSFYVSGSTEAKTNRQKLKIFHGALKEYGCPEKKAPDDWMEAFERLKKILSSDAVYRDPVSDRRVVFIDELPWLDTGKSDFRMALDLFWNTWASAQSDICLIICGSATSWILNKMVMDRGGFHNRLTRQIHLMPFSLTECERYLQSKGMMLPKQQIIKVYMVFGGIPYYLNLLDSRLSLDQNIQTLVFSERGELHNEYRLLFYALFSNPRRHAQIVEALASLKRGMTRAELSAATGISNGSSMTEALFELEQCGFIREFRAYGKSGYGKMYQVIDPFVLFYLTFVKSGRVTSWMEFIGTPAYYAWEGFAFETVCLNHTNQIKWALGISGISADMYSWREKAGNTRKGAQVDLVIDRADSTVDLCEVKYTEEPFTIDEDYKNNLVNKRELFREKTATKKVVRIVLISSNGVKEGGYNDVAQRILVGEDLFDRY